MNVLVLGNGFDLEHDLPTRYKDFLDFMKVIKQLKLINSQQNYNRQRVKENIEKILKQCNSNIKKYFDCDYKNINDFYEAIKKVSEKETIKKLQKLSENNIWLKYFDKEINNENKGWIDFESEISNIIQLLDYVRKNRIEKRIEEKSYINEKEKDIVNIIHECNNYFDVNLYFDSIIKRNKEDYNSIIINPLNIGLSNLINCLEIYLEDFIMKIDVQYIAPDIKRFQYDRMISFNYTSTCERIYPCKSTFTLKTKPHGLFDNKIYDLQSPYEYIHGKVNSDNKKNNMVLGIDEYLDEDKKNKEVDFIGFKKYFQRILKKNRFSLYKLD